MKNNIKSRVEKNKVKDEVKLFKIGCLWNKNNNWFFRYNNWYKRIWCPFTL